MSTSQEPSQGNRSASRMSALVTAAILINLAGGEIVSVLRLPVYGDSVGTVVAGALGGPLTGAFAGALTNIVWSLLGRPGAAAFAITAAAIGMIAGISAQRGWLRTPPRVAVTGLITGVLAAVISAPIATYVYGGVTGGGTDAVVAFFRGMGASILEASLGQGIVSDPLDKLVTFLLAWLVLRAMPRHLLLRYPGGTLFDRADPEAIVDA